MKDHARFRASFAALELMDLLENRKDFRILDIGGGHGIHSSFFKSFGFSVDLVDIEPGEPERVFVGDFLSFVPTTRYDVSWASHVLEHVQDIGLFIKKIICCTKDDGLICITVPPIKTQMTFGHVSLWNAGLLLINLIKCGLDCREAKILTQGYNVSIITPNKLRSTNQYHHYLPKLINFKDGYFEGDIQSVNWNTLSIPVSMRIKSFDNKDIDSVTEEIKQLKESGFLLLRNGDAGSRFYWYDPKSKQLVIVA